MTRLLPVLVLVVILIGIVFFSPLFKIKSVDVNQSENCVSANELESTLKGRNIFLVDLDKIEPKIKNEFLCVREIKSKRVLPNKLGITIETSGVVAKIDGVNFSVSANGEIIEGASKSLPTIFLPSEVKVEKGVKIDNKNILFTLSILEKLARGDYTATNARIVGGQDIAIYNQEGAVAIFTTRKSASDQVDSLHKVLAKAKIDATKIAKIDLRFVNAVIEQK